MIIRIAVFFHVSKVFYINNGKGVGQLEDQRIGAFGVQMPGPGRIGPVLS